jgi:hydroxypyruvate reductase
LVSGGEFACPVKGNGIGGRNLETALRLAIEYDRRNDVSKVTAVRPFVALCAGTDGIDGNSPAAGAIVDQTTIARARAIGLEAEDFLKRSNAYSFFVALGDVVATGATGTNVRDIRILLMTGS